MTLIAKICPRCGETDLVEHTRYTRPHWECGLCKFETPFETRQRVIRNFRKRVADGTFKKALMGVNSK